MTTPPDHPETIERLATAVYPSFAMLAGMQLDLFTPLKDGALTAQQLADALGVRAVKLKPLLYALVAAGLLTVDGELFANTPEADHFLVRGKPTYRGGMHEALSRRWDGILNTAQTISIGLPQAKLDFSTMTPDRMEPLARSRQVETTAAARELVARYDFSSCRNLLDVGGGAGYLSITITEAFPQLQATVVDLPTVTSITQRVVAETETADRVQVVTADVVTGPLTGSFDVAVMRNLIQVLAPEQARRSLRNISKVIEPGGVLYIAGFILDDSLVTPPEMVWMNLNMLNTYDDGAVYTEHEYRAWLAEAGFVGGFERTMLPDGSSVIRARKPA